MYNILIVDDEYLARNKLHFLLDWNAHGFHIQGEVSNACDAIDFINSNPVDVVFADVYMPDMDGIQLAQYIHKNHPEISVIIFSNYSDFDYVKNAFSANVVDYILKYTLTEETMIHTLTILREKRQDNVLSAASLPHIAKEQEYRATIQQAVWNDPPLPTQIPAIIAAMGLHNHHLSMKPYTANEQEMLFQNFENIIATILSPIEGFVILREETNLILYLPFSSEKKEPEIMNLVSHYIQQINTAIYKFFNFDLVWGISMLSSSEYPIHQCYLEACSMLLTQPSKGRKYPFTPEVTAPGRLTISMEKALLSAVSDLNVRKAHQCLELIFAGLNNTDNVGILINDLTAIAVKFCNEFGIDTPETISLPNSFPTPARYLDWAKELFGHIIDRRLNMESVRYQSNYAISAIEYISLNYNSESISLSDIARHIGVSEQHLSKVFKKETGKNLSAFLAEYRIERAKELLCKKNTNLKYLYADVGFNDNSYFCTVFKKYTGCSPKEYRKRQLKI